MEKLPIAGNLAKLFVTTKDKKTKKMAKITYL